MAKRKVIIIGAGVAGLCAGIYAARSGFEVILIEQHSIVGGMCTSWKRKGYLFEGAVHWMIGSSQDDQPQVRRMWEETGALNDRVKIIRSDPFRSVEWEGKMLHFYRDIEKTAAMMRKISPEDEKAISRLVSDVKAVTKLKIPITDVKGVKTATARKMTMGMFFKMMPAFAAMGKLSKITCLDYANQFKHPGLQRLLRFVVDEYSSVTMISTLARLNAGDGGYPEGGSLAMITRMAETFKALGGKLMLNTKVKKVNIHNGNATGVTLDTEVLLADAVIVTSETVAAVKNLFDTPINEPWLNEVCQISKPETCVFVGVGIRAELPETPSWTLDEPITFADRIETDLGFHNYYGYKGYAPEGCTTLTTAFMGDTYEFWKRAKEEGRYEAEKQALSDQICREICKKFPEAEGNIEVIDIATPLTYEHYTDAYHGAWMGFSGVGEKFKTYPGDIKSIKGLYFAGHRIMPPGGQPGALDTGRRAAQMVCRQFGVVFE